MATTEQELALDITRTWKEDAELRAAYGNNPAAYIHFREAQHKLAHATPVEQLPEVTGYVAQRAALGKPMTSDELALVHACAEQWRVSSDLQGEFRSFSTFVAYSRAQAKGLIRRRGTGQ